MPDVCRALKDVAATHKAIKEALESTHSAAHEFIEMSPAIELAAKLRNATEAGERLRSKLSFELPEITHFLRQFGEAFNEFLKSHSKEDAVSLALAGHQAYVELMTLRQTLSAVSGALTPATNLYDSEEQLSLIYTDEADYETLLARLAALKAIYDQLCELANVSTDEYPLRVIKVETGTLHIDVAGCKAVIEAIASLIIKYGSIPYQRFTTPGQIEQLVHLLDLCDELEKRGIDTSNIKESVKSASESVAAKLQTLTTSDKAVDINGESFVRSSPPSRLSFDAKGHLSANDEKGASEPRMLEQATNADKDADHAGSNSDEHQQ